MKKVIKLNEADLNKIVKKILNEDDRIIKGWQIKNTLDFQRFTSKGVTPYYFDSSVDGNFKMVEITQPLVKSTKEYTRIFLLKPDELEKIEKIISNLNELTLQYLKKIELFKEYIPSLISEIINK